MAKSVLNDGALLPEGVTDFLHRRLSEAAGIVLAASAIALLLSLAAYSPGDPSLNSATGGEALNLLGRGGAYAADVLLQAFGLAAVVPPAVLAAWGWLYIRKRRLTFFWLRLFLGVCALLFLGLAFAALPSPRAWPLVSGLGGVVGSLLLRELSALAGFVFGASLEPGTVGFAAGLTGLLLGPAALIGAFGFGRSDWALLRQGTVFAAAIITRAGSRAAAFFRGLAERRRNNGKDAPPAKAGTQKAPSRKGKRPGALDGLVARNLQRTRAGGKTLVEAKPGKAKPGKRAQAARQQSLDLVPGEYHFPPLDLLRTPPENRAGPVNTESLQQNARLLETVLEDFGVRGEITKVRPGPVVTLYELEPAPGTKTSRVIGLSDDIARSMSAISVRVAVVPGRNAIGIELPNAAREMVYLSELLASDSFERSPGKLALALGKDIGGAPVIADLTRMPHLLIAGTTGSGKSVGINTMILSLLYQHRPDDCRFIMIDPKMLELSVYEGIPHLLTPVVTDPSKAVVALKWTVREMEDRYRAMAQLGVRNIDGYNARLDQALKKGEALTRRVQTGFDEDGKPIFEDQPLSMEPLPFIVVVVDEMADLMLVAGKDVEAAIQRLAQMARAAGIHLIMATQRPSVDVITGTIKANFPTRISFQVTSKIDSRTILGEQGAEQLLGQGDMLSMSGGGRITRVHGPFVSDEEVESIVTHLKTMGEPAYLEDVTAEEEQGPASSGEASAADALYDEAVALIAREGKASTSFIQRHLQIGYNRAARIIELMEREGVVSPANRVGRREVLIGNHGDHAA